MTAQIRKKLSPNDLGETGTHQAGIHIPKQEDMLSFFPALSNRTKNPRVTLVVREYGDGTRWNFNYIYYNNKFFGGTRNEYRLTGMTAYLRAVGAHVHEEISLSRDEDGTYVIQLHRATKASDDKNTLKLSGGWKVHNNAGGYK